MIAFTARCPYERYRGKKSKYWINGATQTIRSCKDGMEFVNTGGLCDCIPVDTGRHFLTSSCLLPLFTWCCGKYFVVEFLEIRIQNVHIICNDEYIRSYTHSIHMCVCIALPLAFALSLYFPLPHHVALVPLSPSLSSAFITSSQLNVKHKRI